MFLCHMCRLIWFQLLHTLLLSCTLCEADLLQCLHKTYHSVPYMSADLSEFSHLSYYLPCRLMRFSFHMYVYCFVCRLICVGSPYIVLLRLSSSTQCAIRALCKTDPCQLQQTYIVPIHCAVWGGWPVSLVAYVYTLYGLALCIDLFRF